MINLAVVGLGHWGPNLARNIAALPNARLHRRETAAGL
jgi:hypothetical protein